MEVNESSPGVEGEATPLKADGVTPAKLDGPLRFTLSNDPFGNPVGTLLLDAAAPSGYKITPLPVPDSVEGPTHSAILRAEGDGDLDAGEERIVFAEAVFTVRRDEAQTIGITMREIGPSPTP